jgi:hypothetical protein
VSLANSCGGYVERLKNGLATFWTTPAKRSPRPGASFWLKSGDFVPNLYQAGVEALCLAWQAKKREQKLE